MTAVLYFVQNYANALIIILGIGIAIALLVNGGKLSSHKVRIEEALQRRNKNYFLNAATKEMEENDDMAAAITPDTIRSFEAAFNKACSVHNILVQFIPVFPLLGILGTVAGLMLQVKAEDISSVMGALDTALSSTFWGLVFAIILKIIEAVSPSRIIGEVEVMLDDFDKKLSIAEMFRSSASDGE